MYENPFPLRSRVNGIIRHRNCIDNKTNGTVNSTVVLDMRSCRVIRSHTVVDVTMDPAVRLIATGEGRGDLGVLTGSPNVNRSLYAFIPNQCGQQ